MFTTRKGIDIATWRIRIGTFITKDHRHFQNSFTSSSNKVHKTKSLLIPYWPHASNLLLLALNYIMLQSMDIELNPGPPATSTITESRHPIPRHVIFSSLFNKTKRLLELVRFEHHLYKLQILQRKTFYSKVASSTQTSATIKQKQFLQNMEPFMIF